MGVEWKSVPLENELRLREPQPAGLTAELGGGAKEKECVADDSARRCPERADDQLDALPASHRRDPHQREPCRLGELRQHEDEFREESREANVIDSAREPASGLRTVHSEAEIHRQRRRGHRIIASIRGVLKRTDGERHGQMGRQQRRPSTDNGSAEAPHGRQALRTRRSPGDRERAVVERDDPLQQFHALLVLRADRHVNGARDRQLGREPA